MLDKIKIWHILLVSIIIIAIFRVGQIVDLFLLMLEYLSLAFSSDYTILPLKNFSLIDNFVSVLLLFFVPIFILFSMRLQKVLVEKVSWEKIVLSLLIISFLWAPLITGQHPEFQKDITVTKLLPPFSKVSYINLNKTAALNKSKTVLLKDKTDKILPETFNSTIIHFDSLYVNKSVYYFQAGIKKEIPLSSLENSNGVPIIGKKLFLFGSDEYGRDVFTRLIYGTRLSLLVGFSSVLVSLFLGLLLSFIAAEKGGLINLVITRITDLFLSFPAVFLVIIILALFGSNIISVIIVLGFSGWMSLFKVVKAEILNIKTKEYFISAKMLGTNKLNLLIREILPVIIVPVLVNIIFQFSNVILAESALSFLGLGIGNEYPSWGKMIESGQKYISQAWWLIFIPGIMLVTTLLSLNEVGRKIKQNINPTYI